MGKVTCKCGWTGDQEKLRVSKYCPRCEAEFKRTFSWEDENGIEDVLQSEETEPEERSVIWPYGRT
mgnify:CR=1 FL=1